MRLHQPSPLSRVRHAYRHVMGLGSGLLCCNEQAAMACFGDIHDSLSMVTHTHYTNPELCRISPAVKPSTRY
jgi:hypothetical protein